MIDKNVTSAIPANLGTLGWIAKDGRRPVANVVVWGAEMVGAEQLLHKQSPVSFWWKACDPSEYKMLFVKYISDVWQDHYDTLLSYADPYRIQDGQVIHQPTLSLFPNFVGTDLVRILELAGTQLTLSTVPIRVMGVIVNVIIIWERVT
ncbi:MAG: lipocalin-like domain-containing protein [Anaerolineae bacterium]|nr:lipocalin-like domain-containing protein [Anaerolineae bacterium]